jgi:hypothetical protein
MYWAVTFGKWAVMLAAGSLAGTAYEKVFLKRSL